MPPGYRIDDMHILDDPNRGRYRETSAEGTFKALGNRENHMTSQASSVNDSVREQFGAAANAYATSAVHASGPDLAAMVRLADLTGTEQVLDMGSGAGHWPWRSGRKRLGCAASMSRPRWWPWPTASPANVDSRT